MTSFLFILVKKKEIINYLTNLKRARFFKLKIIKILKLKIQKNKLTSFCLNLDKVEYFLKK